MNKTLSRIALTIPIVAIIVGVQAAEGVIDYARADTFDICSPGLGGDNMEGVIDGTPTSCPFAANVRQAWFTQPGNPIRAYSPVTDRIYPMTCISSTETVSGVRINGWTCYGGNDAEVVIWR